ncbi:hypothetical protein CEXT_659401 [Caerostris extrusa]|uniref:Uncharacterized protein n=1 Tax=Caerostris extrusa TaxID=172846 RepID=A0AAV4M4R0_CAEEX|nr:hypothetical protein CEXT_659401 [Caerostris extrusa]
MTNSGFHPPPEKCPSSLSPYIREEIVSRKGVTFDKVILDLGSIFAVTLSTKEAAFFLIFRKSVLKRTAQYIVHGCLRATYLGNPNKLNNEAWQKTKL